jgi:micrococcal nuclease
MKRRRKYILKLSLSLLAILISIFFESTYNKSSQGTPEIIPQAETLGASSEVAHVTRIVDGDTIELEGGQKVRYIGINTPEKDECYGSQATAHNAELVLNKEVVLKKDVSETDRYGRLLRYVYVDDVFVNNQLVLEGYAQASSYPPDINQQTLFRESERIAREKQLGLWGAPLCP